MTNMEQWFNRYKYYKVRGSAWDSITWEIPLFVTENEYFSWCHNSSGYCEIDWTDELYLVNIAPIACSENFILDILNNNKGDKQCN